MRRITLFLLAFLTWYVLTWPFDFAERTMDWQSIIVGIIASLAVAFLFKEAFAKRHYIFYDVKRYFWLFLYFFVFLYYMIMANLDVMYRVVHPAMPIKPGIVKVKTRLRTHTAMTFLCNCITLTPGTLSVDLDLDAGEIWVHWINVRAKDVEGATENIVRRFENMLGKIFE